MALTYSMITNTVVGNMRLVVFNAAGSAAEENITSAYTGLTKISAVLAMSVQSGTTSTTGFVWHENVDSSGTASGGCIGYSGLAGGGVSMVIRGAVLGY